MALEVKLEAADGLSISGEADALRLAWRDGDDWLGPIGFRAADGSACELAAAEPFFGDDALGAHAGLRLSWRGAPREVRSTVRAYSDRPLVVFRLEAVSAWSAPATDAGAFESPVAGWPWLRPDQRAAGGVPPGSAAFGHGYTEFALPWPADDCFCGFGRIPGRPAIAMPVWLLAPDGHGLMLAPLDAFHDQIIAVPPDAEQAARGVVCGWHGDLESVPAGFASELALWVGDSPRRSLETHCAWLRAHHGTPERSRYRDDATGRLSYWTDNGAAYWYRTEPGLDITETLEATLADLRAADVPFRAVEIDSWFYPHEHLRPVNPAGQTIVPPSGAMRWEARDDVLPDGVGALARRLGSPPLIFHGRHFSSKSSYWDEHEAWIDGDRAHPKGPELLRKLMAQAASWGAIQYEQDWLVEAFLGVRGLRAAPGRAQRWQRDLDTAVTANGLSLLLCMATPADLFNSVSLPSVASARTSGDYHYIVGNGFLWTWFLHTNALARALGLPASKDVFLSSREGEGHDGDPHAEAEALLAALSAGPVGIGDRRGRTDRDLVLRCCRPDGVLVKPDAPIAALDRCYGAHAFTTPSPLLGETYTDHPAGRWVYLASLHAYKGDEALDFRVALEDLGESAPTDDVLVYDWRRGETQRLAPSGEIAVTLEHREWDYRVVCPILDGEVAVIGDPSLYATAGDRRVRDVRSKAGGVSFEVLGVPGEHVRILGWSARPAQCEGAAVSRDARTGHWSLRVRVGDRGWEPVRLRS